MVDGDGNRYKSMTMQESRTSTVYFGGGFDNGTQAISWNVNNTSRYQMTNQTDILVPLIIDSASISVKAENIYLTAACADIRKTGLYTVGESDMYYGLRLAIKDGG